MSFLGENLKMLIERPAFNEFIVSLFKNGDCNIFIATILVMNDVLF